MCGGRRARLSESACPGSAHAPASGRTGLLPFETKLGFHPGAEPTRVSVRRAHVWQSGSGPRCSLRRGAGTDPGATDGARGREGGHGVCGEDAARSVSSAIGGETDRGCGTPDAPGGRWLGAHGNLGAVRARRPRIWEEVGQIGETQAEASDTFWCPTRQPRGNVNVECSPWQRARTSAATRR